MNNFNCRNNVISNRHKPRDQCCADSTRMHTNFLQKFKPKYCKCHTVALINGYKASQLKKVLKKKITLYTD